MPFVTIVPHSLQGVLLLRDFVVGQLYCVNELGYVCAAKTDRISKYT
jgi:hypothetical protein